MHSISTNSDEFRDISANDESLSDLSLSPLPSQLTAPTQNTCNTFLLSYSDHIQRSSQRRGTTSTRSIRKEGKKGNRIASGLARKNHGGDDDNQGLPVLSSRGGNQGPSRDHRTGGWGHPKFTQYIYLHFLYSQLAFARGHFKPSCVLAVASLHGSPLDPSCVL